MKKVLAKVVASTTESKINGITTLLFDIVHIATLDYMNGIIALYNDTFPSDSERNQTKHETLETRQWIIDNADYYTNGEINGKYLVEKCDKRLVKLIEEQEQ